MMHCTYPGCRVRLIDSDDRCENHSISRFGIVRRRSLARPQTTNIGRKGYVVLAQNLLDQGFHPMPATMEVLSSATPGSVVSWTPDHFSIAIASVFLDEGEFYEEEAGISVPCTGVKGSPMRNWKTRQVIPTTDRVPRTTVDTPTVVVQAQVWIMDRDDVNPIRWHSVETGGTAPSRRIHAQYAW